MKKKIFHHPKELSQPLTPVEMTGLISGSFVMTLLFILTGMFMPYYYTEIVGISAAVVGSLMLVTRIVNAFTDVGMGMIIAKTHTKYGKARPWLLRMALPLAASVVLAFSVPSSMSGGSRIMYACVTHMLMITVAFTAVGIAGAVLGPSMTSSDKSREKNAVIGSVAVMIGSVLGAVGIQRYTAGLGDSPEAWRNIAVIFSVIAVIGQGIQFFFTRERTSAQTASESEKAAVHNNGFRQMLPALTKNKYFIIMLIVAFFTAIDGALAGAQMYYYKFIFNDTSIIGIVSIATLIAAIISIISIPFLTKKFRKRTLMVFGLGIKTVCYGIIALFPTHVLLFVVLSAIRAFANGPMMALAGVFLLNTIEYGQYKTGIRADSLIVTVSSFGNKIGMGLGGAVIGWVLAVGGYIGGTETQPGMVKYAVIFICCIIPLIIALTQIILLMFYNLDKQYNEIAERL